MKKEPWRWIVFGLAVAYIIYLWVSKSIGDTGSSIPREELLPMVLTGVAVTAVKVILIAAVLLLIRWLLAKFKK